MPPQEKMPENGASQECEAQCYNNPAFIPDTQNAKKEKQDKDAKGFEFDDLLPHIGEFGIYQKILFLMMIPFAFFVAWVYFTQIFITIIPDQHWCWVPELANLTVEER